MVCRYKFCLSNLYNELSQCPWLKTLTSWFAQCMYSWGQNSIGSRHPVYTQVWLKLQARASWCSSTGLLSPQHWLAFLPFLVTYSLKTHPHCSTTSLTSYHKRYLRDQGQETDSCPLMRVHSTGKTIASPHKKAMDRTKGNHNHRKEMKRNNNKEIKHGGSGAVPWYYITSHFYFRVTRVMMSNRDSLYWRRRVSEED